MLSNFKNLIKKKDHNSPVADEFRCYSEIIPRYRIEAQIGEGAFSKVFRALDTVRNEEIAIKIIDKSSMTIQQINGILKEIAIMSKLDHENIVKLLAYKNSSNSRYCYLFLELVQGGEIFNQIIKYTYFSEDLSRHVIVQVVRSIKYLHEQVGVVHRDIKPENLLFVPIPVVPTPVHEQRRRQSDDANKLDEGKFKVNVGAGGIGTVKLADFGLSKVLWDRNTNTPCGTVGYTAPEIVKDEYYSKSVDVWAIGCVLYTLLCGFPPFYDTDPRNLAEKVSKGEYCFLSPWWDEISKEAKDLVSNLLTLDPSKRYTLDEILQHPWILQNSQITEPAFDAPPPTTHNSQLYQHFNDTSESLQTPRAEAIKLMFDTSAAMHAGGNNMLAATAVGSPSHLTAFGIVEEENEDMDVIKTNAQHHIDHGSIYDSSISDSDSDSDSNSNWDHPSKSPMMRRRMSSSSIVKPRRQSTVSFLDSVKPRQLSRGHHNDIPRTPDPSRSVSSSLTMQTSESFDLKIGGSTMLLRRKRVGSSGCGPKAPEDDPSPSELDPPLASAIY
ncbi:unnamed protein product [Kuraishia capsulata CBS 1993]|uniref:Protein kinase domain-containing protein n=1 Tax=Kuraishia capsulata CBS 1993 TaxID=1382522 RepID=W6MHW0_9ASCO|nr:uncharacterized protein KUCA_T00001910001 [Kuraishia capsulata CBS 1993]CDK25939.1 unnamed protein product [Kuraishia capsulata CBS 1993]